MTEMPSIEVDLFNYVTYVGYSVTTSQQQLNFLHTWLQLYIDVTVCLHVFDILFFSASSYFTFDSTRRKGTAYILNNLYYSVGKPFVPVTYIISVMCFNSVTNPLKLALTYFTVEGKINDFDVEVFEDKSFLAPKEDMTIFVTVKVCLFCVFHCMCSI